MSSKAQSHYQRYQHHAAFAARLESALPADQDWCCVVMFYAALHLLDAYLATKAFVFPIDSHPSRNRAISQSPELRRFGTSYRELQDVSEQVRYDPGFIFQQTHYADAKANLAKVAAALDSKVKRLLGIK
jgi:hypothetical protein